MDPSKHCITHPSCSNTNAKCVRKQNLLVYEKNNPCIEKSTLPKSCYITPLKRANAKKIRVCTAADLKRMCAPKLCSCTAKRHHTGIWTSIGRLLGFGVKSALAGGLIYWTYGIGLWGKPDETEQIYVDLCKYAYKPDKREMERLLAKAREQRTTFQKSCDPFTNRKKQFKSDDNSDVLISEDTIMAQMKLCQQAPSIRDNTNSFKNSWNNHVVSAFAFIVNLPNRLFGCEEPEEVIDPKKKKNKKDAEDCDEKDEKNEKPECPVYNRCGRQPTMEG